MRYKLPLLMLVALVAIVGAATSVAALERTAQRWDDARPESEEWRLGASTCSISYYNICSGYIWVWNGWPDGGKLGVHYTSCCEAGEDTYLDSVWFYFVTGTPPSYGFTGTFEVRDVDGNLCPSGGVYHTSPLLPATGWNQVVVGGTQIPAETAAVITTSDANGFNSPAAIATDMPANDAGTCYPTTRVSNSYTWGSTASPLCPGSAFADTPANAELLMSYILSCVPSTAVEEESWGSIKVLYR